MNILSWFRLIADRRKEKRPVSTDRRRGGHIGKSKAIQERLETALDDFERTVSIKRDDFFRFSANDIQQEVQFDTFRAICRFRVNGGQYKLCRNSSHEAANTGIAICDEQLCPFMRVQKVPA